MPKIDFGKLRTEQTNPRSKNIDSVSITKALKIINAEDRVVPKAVSKVIPEISRAVSIITKQLKKNGSLYFSGAGTSGRLGILEAAECPPTFNTPPSLIQALMAGGKSSVFKSKEGAEDNQVHAYQFFIKKLRPNDVLVGIAASGVTPFVYGSLKAAKRIGCPTILITCADKLYMKNVAQIIIAPQVGPEVITGSTRLKAGTATKLVLNMLTVTSMVQLGKVYDHWMVDLQPRSAKLKARALRVIQRLGNVSEPVASRLLQESYGNAKTAILMARKNLSRAQALNKLKRHQGFLKKALSE